ncbi:Two-component response regulator ARR6 [Camellia lanceoleosa]|uniref:Two-component response regulator ARR6 n=1 Tax=Camellia lanceoleosa TaxID=1840588 RepID=A0ACC0I7Y4_9ERIC|nr:Two-component response regulator ARR6 [Camellia lanceoleosa]
MARTAGKYLLRRSPTKVEGSNHLLSSGSRELHVLAVDDSHVDRRVIERLLKISSCRVTAVENGSREELRWIQFTAVKSGSRALQYLDLDIEKSSVGFNAAESTQPVVMRAAYAYNKVMAAQVPTGK